jgi:O-antigen biosynthesis protein WbqP
MKRAFDLAAAVTGLAVLWPLILAAVMTVRLTSPGPGIFVQTRVGRGGRPFALYKLRTMYTGTAHVPSHHVGKSALTPVGERLRRWKIDELPQLINVVKGEMSLVGPRPCLPSQTELIAARLRTRSLDVLPGITGLAQVKGIDMSDPERLAEVDGWYARNRTFWGDLRLVVLTATGGGLGLDAVTTPGPSDHQAPTSL